MSWDTAERLNMIRPPVKAANRFCSDQTLPTPHPLFPETIMCKRMLAAIAAILTILIGSVLLAEEAAGPYLYEQLTKPAYKATFKALFKGQKNLEPWLREYISRGNGVDIPSEKRIVAGKSLEYYEICQPHNCPGNVLSVLFEPGGGKAWALFTRDDGARRVFGNPDAAVRAALGQSVQ
jgi:hypothetical protein